jgi:hypothetical protein
MNTRKLYGKDGELIILYQNNIFAHAERFTAELSEKTTLVNAGKIGAYEVGTGYKLRLRLNDITVNDTEAADEIMKGMQEGNFPEFGFQGIFKRIDGYGQKIIFRRCVFSGSIDFIGLAKGFICDLDLTVNELTQEQIELFNRHGR